MGCTVGSIGLRDPKPKAVAWDLEACFLGMSCFPFPEGLRFEGLALRVLGLGLGSKNPNMGCVGA